MSLDRVLAALEARGGCPRGTDTRGYMACCPAHADRTPSLSVGYRDGRVLLHCFAGCSTPDVLAALDLPWGALFDPGLLQQSGWEHRLHRVRPAPELAENRTQVFDW